MTSVRELLTPSIALPELVRHNYCRIPGYDCARIQVCIVGGRYHKIAALDSSQACLSVNEEFETRLYSTISVARDSALLR